VATEETATAEAPRNLDLWLCQELRLNESDPERVAGLLEQALEDARYHSVTRAGGGGTIRVSGRFGSKLWTTLVGLVPLGAHTRWGKRLGVQATVRGEGARTKVTLRATPFMELFDESEALLISQSPAEKGTDEYFASLHLHRIADALRAATKTPRPDDASKLEPKAFTADFATGLVLYLFEGAKTKKLVHVPAEPRGSWNWKAFFFPEFWFVWHEIWGPSLLVWIIEFQLFKVLDEFPGSATLVFAAAVAAGLRLAAGATADPIFYARHGRWPDEPTEGS